MVLRLGGMAGFVLLLLLPPPPGLELVAWRTAAVAALMALWWMTEAIPIPATALLPLVLFPALGILDMSAAAAPYANEVIYLFLGGFLLAIAMERWGLHRRLGLAIVAAVGTTPRRLILGFMVATAFLSMWISNTAATAMMLPIALAVAELFRPASGPGRHGSGFAVALLLGMAYAASIGGVATLIGTPPNAVMAAAASELLGIQVSFVEWMAVGIPAALIFLPLTWFLLVNVLYPQEVVGGEAAELLKRERASLGPPSQAEWTVGVVFALTAAAWVFRAPLELGGVTIPGLQMLFPDIRDSTIAMAAAVALFLLPADRETGSSALSWEDGKKVPWGVLVLFGGGLSLAVAMDRSGLAAWLGTRVIGLATLPPAVLLAMVAALFIFLTEITSNTATSTMAMPLMVGVAAALGMDALVLMATAALASSMAFMLPVATPPNAIVFGSGELTIKQMARAGFIMNLISILLVTFLVIAVVPRVFPD